MIEKKFKIMVKSLAKSGADIKNDMTDLQAELAHMAMLVMTEAGELGSALKSHTISQKPMDRENIIEELGDIEWAIERIRQLLNISRAETLEANFNKQIRRYPGMRYTNAHAQNKIDKIAIPPMPFLRG